MPVLLPKPYSLDYCSSVAGRANSDYPLELFLSPVFSIAFVIIIIHNNLPQRICPLYLTVRVPLVRALSSRGWLEGRNEQIPPELAILGDARLMAFTLLPSSSPPHLCPIKESGTQAPVRWLP